MSFMLFTSCHLRHLRFCFQFVNPFERLWSVPAGFFCSEKMTSLDMLDMYFANLIVLGKYFVQWDVLLRCLSDVSSMRYASQMSLRRLLNEICLPDASQMSAQWDMPLICFLNEIYASQMPLICLLNEINLSDALQKQIKMSFICLLNELLEHEVYDPGHTCHLYMLSYGHPFCVCIWHGP